jgi:alpha 1,6-mannosyltransferase
MIPKIIWQTYKVPYNSLPDYALQATQSWKKNNPKWNYKYMNDQEILDFVLNQYGKKWYKIFINCPKGVMRADLWRYMIIYKYGGLYSDLDTVCKVPIDKWLKPEYNMVICPENDLHFCQWTFAAVPKHPIIKKVLEVINEGFNNPNYGNKHFVHALTGPGVWTKGIKLALNINEQLNEKITDSEYFNELEKAKKYKLFCYEYKMFYCMAVKHLYGSQNWNDGKYEQWIK